MRFAVLTLALIAVGGCIEEAPPSRHCPCDPGWNCCLLDQIKICIEASRMCGVTGGDDRLAPYPVGARWVYRVKSGSREEIKTQTVGPLEPVPPPPDGPWDLIGHRISGELRRGSMLLERNDSWQQHDGLRAVRHHERRLDASGDELEAEWWRPGRLRVDEAKREPRWVEEFQSFMRLREDAAAGVAREWRSNTDSWVALGEAPCEVPAGIFSCFSFKRGENKKFWFVRGIGKVKEEGRGVTEELLQFERD